MNPDQTAPKGPYCLHIDYRSTSADEKAGEIFMNGIKV